MQEATPDIEPPELVAFLQQTCPLNPKPQVPRNVRLSWPHAGDRRRAKVGKSPSPSDGRRNRRVQVDSARMIHVSQKDMEIHYHRTGSSLHDAQSPSPDFCIPLSWNPTKLAAKHQELFHYFQHVASTSLATFGQDPAELGRALIRIAVADNTSSDTAVLRSLLAVAALHRHGVHQQAFELKLSALEALKTASSENNVGTVAEAMRHVAAGMMLCSFEIHQASCTSGEWQSYLRGVKCVIRAAGLHDLQQDGDLGLLLDWVYYHDVLASFSLRHWKRAATSVLSPSAVNVAAKRSQAAPQALELIALLSDMNSAVSGKTPVAPSPEYDERKSYLTILDWRIRSFDLTAAATEARADADAPLIVEAYQLAMLVYLGRASNNLVSSPARTREHVDKGLALLARLRCCDRQFPVFILGCEARTDEERAVVLDLIARTEDGASSRSFNYARLLLQAIWTQDDLADKDAGNYWDKISYVLSCCRILPTFV